MKKEQEKFIDITIRISSRDFVKIQKKAAQEKMTVQELIAFLIHKEVEKV